MAPWQHVRCNQTPPPASPSILPACLQANAFTRLPPLVALYAGDPRLGLVVEAMIRRAAPQQVYYVPLWP